MKIGDRVRIIREDFGHPDLNPISGLIGEITLVEDPWKADKQQRMRYEVCWSEPIGSRGYTGHFPLFEADLELIVESNSSAIGQEKAS